MRSIENYNSWIKSTSLDDDCESYSSQKLVKPHKIHSIQGIDLISSTVISSSQKITFLKGQGLYTIRRITRQNISQERQKSYTITGTNIQNNLLKIKYERVNYDTEPTDMTKNTREEAETYCFIDNALECQGILYSPIYR